MADSDDEDDLSISELSSLSASQSASQSDLSALSTASGQSDAPAYGYGPDYNETLQGNCVVDYKGLAYVHAFQDQAAVCSAHPAYALPLHVDMEACLSQYVCCTGHHSYADRARNVCESCNRLGHMRDPVRLVRVARCSDVHVCVECFHKIMWHSFPLRLVDPLLGLDK